MSNTDNLEDKEFTFVGGGLGQRLLQRAGLPQSGVDAIRWRMLGFIGLTYLPLLVLAMVQNVAFGSILNQPYIFDIAEITRFLVVGPMLIAVEPIIEPWLAQVIRYARERLILAEETERFQKLISQTVAVRDSDVVEIIILLGIFVWQWFELHVQTAPNVVSWQQLPGDGGNSYAWYWFGYVAKPLLRFLWLRWIWRYLTWSFLLFRLPTFKLRIKPMHPDRLGGLGFIAVGHGKFTALAFTFGVLAAGILGQEIVFSGRTLMSFRYDIITLAAVILVVFLTPLLAFTSKLLEAKRIGLFEYGAFADEYISDFRIKWIHGERSQEQLLGTSDIQSLADLANSYDVVREMRTCLISKDSIMSFLLATLVPFLPLMLTVYPFDELLKRLLKALM
jgi:hypothetical protein